MGPSAQPLLHNMSVAPRQLVELRPARLGAEAVLFDLVAALEALAATKPTGSGGASASRLESSLRLVERLQAWLAPMAAGAERRANAREDLERALDDASRSLGLVGAALLVPPKRAPEARLCLDPLLAAIVLAKSDTALFVAGKQATCTRDRLTRALVTRERWLVDLARARNAAASALASAATEVEAPHVEQHRVDGTQP